MRSSIALLAALASMALPAGAGAAERTVTLAVENMTCATCAPVVKQSLARVAGVTKVEVRVEQKRAVVVFDDAETSVSALLSATANAGYPSRTVE